MYKLSMTKKTTKQNPIHKKQQNLKKPSRPPKKCTSLSSPRNPQNKNQFIKPLKEQKTKIKWVTASYLELRDGSADLVPLWRVHV